MADPSSSAARCLHCGSENPQGFRFCGACGNELAVDSSRSERRQVSVLFADLVGFTTISEKRDSEEVRELLTRYFATARESITRYGGTVEKFIGDAVMAVWGSPAAHEDDAERSVRAALDLVASVSQLGRSLGIGNLNLRVGIMSGEAFVTLDAVGQGMVAGDLVNTAARLQSIAEPGTVLVGRGTYRSARATIEFEEVATRVLKGKTGSTRVYRAAGVIAEKGRSDLPRRLEPPFVGRDEELTALRMPLESAIRENRLHLGFLFGIGGIGKSRLVWELSKQANDFAEDVLWLQGRASAYGEDVSLLPLAEILRSVLGIADSDNTEAIRQKLSSALRTHVSDEEERRWIGRRLAPLIGLKPGSDGGRHELFAAVRTFIDRISGSGLTVLVLDDAQWADDSMFDFIDHLIDYDATRPIVVLVLARPEFLDRRGDWLSRVSSSISLSLGPLPDEVMSELLTGMVSTASTEAFSSIVQRADGVPLYAVETMKMLIDDGRIRSTNDGFVLEAPITELEIPDSLNALVASRLDVLPAQEQALIKDASVLGSTFSLASLTVISGSPTEETRSKLRSLMQRRLVALDNDDPKSPHRTVYGFIGGLIPEIAYQMLSKRDRYMRHRAAAAYFESDTTEGDPTVAAAHYVKALAHATDEEAASVTTQVKNAYELAARRSIEHGSYNGALGHVRQALRLTGEGSDRARLDEMAADLALKASDPEGAEKHLLETFDWYEQQSDPASLARVSARLGGIHLGRGDRIEGMQRLEAGLGTLVGMGALTSHPDNPHLAITLAEALLTDGLFLQANNWAEEAMAGAEELGQPEVVAAALVSKGKSAHAAGRWREALGLLMGARAMTEEFEFSHVRLRSLLALSNVWQLVRPARALTEAQRAATLAHRLGLPEEESQALSTASWMALLTEGREGIGRLLGEVQESSSSLETAASVFRRVAEHVLDGELGAALDSLRKLQSESSVPLEPWIAEIRLLKKILAGEGQSAAAEAVESAYYRKVGYLDNVRSLAQAGRASLWSRDPRGVESALAAIESFKPNGAPWVALAEAALRAGLDSLSGSNPDTGSVYLQSIAEADEIGASFDAALLHLDLAFLGVGDEQHSKQAKNAARQRFVELGAEGLWERFKAAYARDGFE